MKTTSRQNDRAEHATRRPQYEYIPRFGIFRIYRRNPDGTSRHVQDALTREQARRIVYKLNGWKEKADNRRT